MKSPLRVIRELIGRTARTFRKILPYSAPTRDLTKADYAFYDKARRGKATGLEISGLLIKPVCSKIASWSLGRQSQFTMASEPGRQAINKWWHGNHSDILQGYEDSLALGDSYFVINPDLTVTVLPPDIVEPIVASDDYSQTIGWKVTERWPHPTNPADWMTIEDTYTAQERIRRITRGSGVAVSEKRYPNMIGVLPIVHIANNRGINQANGVPEVEALVEELHEYGEILTAALSGNKLQGRPTPVVSLKDADAVDKFFDTNAETKTQELADGTTETYQEVQFSADSVLAIAGNFEYAQPGSFTGDTRTLLEILYLLYVEHTELPEFVMGSAIASSRASAETQMPVFTRFIEKKRGQAEKWMLQVVRIVQGYMALGIEPGVSVEEAAIEWPKLVEDDNQLTLTAIQWAYAEGLVDDETALVLMPVDIKNPTEVLDKARLERDERDKTRTENDYQAVFQQALADETPVEPSPDDENVS